MGWKLDRSDFIVGVNSAGKVVPDRIPPATEQEVKVYEVRIGATLPEDYREFLKTINGGGLNPHVERYICFDVNQPYAGSAITSGSSQILNYLFTLSAVALEKAGTAGILALESSYQYYLDSEWDYPYRPEDFVPIGNTPGSNLIVIGLRGEHKGKVATYEYMEMDAEQPLGNVFHVADSFDEFLEALHPCQ